MLLEVSHTIGPRTGPDRASDPRKEGRRSAKRRFKSILTKKPAFGAVLVEGSYSMGKLLA